MIFDINNEAVKTIEDVVKGMHDFTTDTGELHVTVFDDAGYVKVVGYYACNMDKEAFDEEYETLAGKIHKMVDFIIPECGSDRDLLVQYLNELCDNCFAEHIISRARRIVRLRELKAPQICIDDEIKAFTYYWVLNQYCDTF